MQICLRLIKIRKIKDIPEKNKRIQFAGEHKIIGGDPVIVVGITQISIYDMAIDIAQKLRDLLL